MGGALHRHGACTTPGQRVFVWSSGAARCCPAGIDPAHRNRAKRATYRTQRTAGAGRCIVQHRLLGAPPAIARHLQRQHMRRARCHAPPAAGAAGRVNGGQGFGGHGLKGHGQQRANDFGMTSSGRAPVRASSAVAPRPRPVNRPCARRRNNRVWGFSFADGGDRFQAAVRTPCKGVFWGRESGNPHWPAAPW